MTPLRTCRVCGCTDELACPGGCAWAGPDLCTRCSPVTTTTQTPSTRVNLTTGSRKGGPGGSKTDTVGGTSIPLVGSARRNVTGPASTPGPVTPGHPAWHEVTYLHPRWGYRSNRWVPLEYARRAARRVREKHPGVSVEIWAVYHDHAGNHDRSELVETLGGAP